MNRKVAVIAGTPVDTNMGVCFLKKQNPGLEVLACPAKENPEACHLLQLRPEAEKQAFFREMMREALADGCRDFFIYCNSLSATVDFEALGRELGARIYTPLQVYRQLGRSYRSLAVIAANNQSTAGIEKCLCEENPSVSVLGVGFLALVEAIEERIAPKSIVLHFALQELCEYFEKNGAEALILGCTHFPYFKEALEAVTELPLIDPAEEMYRALCQAQ